MTIRSISNLYPTHGKNIENSPIKRSNNTSKLAIEKFSSSNTETTSSTKKFKATVFKGPYYSFRNAIRSGKVENLKELIKNNYNVNCENIHGHTPLLYAAKSQNTEMVNILLQNKANVNHKNKAGESPIAVATLLSSVPMIKQLLYYKAEKSDSIEVLSTYIPRIQACLEEVEKSATTKHVLSNGKTVDRELLMKDYSIKLDTAIKLLNMVTIYKPEFNVDEWNQHQAEIEKLLEA